MRALFGISVLAFLFIACDEIKEDDNIATSKVELLTSLEDSDQEETNDTLKKHSAILLTGRGSEPGWSAEFYADKVKLILDHGEIQEEIAHDFSTIANDKLFKLNLTNIFSSNGKKEIKKFSVLIEKTACKEESTGEMKERKITLSFNDKTYTGCAETNRAEAP